MSGGINMQVTTAPGSGAEPGWYPDYDSPSGHERYWDGAGWTDQRRAPTPRARTSRRVTALVVLLLLAVAGTALGAALLTGEDGDPRSSVQNTSGAPAEAVDPAPSEVREVLDGRTLGLGVGTEVRLVGIDVPSACADAARAELADLVRGRSVTLTRRGIDADAQGRLLRYVELDGVDVGLRLIRRGLATATDESHARGQIYRRVDARTASVC